MNNLMFLVYGVHGAGGEAVVALQLILHVLHRRCQQGTGPADR